MRPGCSRRTSARRSAGSGSTCAGRRRCSRRRATACSARSRSTARRRTRATCTCSRWSRAPSSRSATCGRWPPGEVRSAFAMTEPAPGAGSDPTMLLTTARRDGTDWVIDGRKHLITGAQGCAFYICMARSADEIRHDEGATMLLVPADNPGVRVERLIPTMDRAFSGGHAVVSVRELPGASRRGAGRGRARLPLRAGAPGARAADALHALARARAPRARHRARPGRRALGVRRAAARARHGAGARGRLGDRHRGEPRADPQRAPRCSTPAAAARTSRRWRRSSCPRPWGAIVDRSLQICGGLGASDDLPLARYAREVRAFRIYDGPSETHRWSIARRAARRRQRER